VFGDIVGVRIFRDRDELHCTYDRLKSRHPVGRWVVVERIRLVVSQPGRFDDVCHCAAFEFKEVRAECTFADEKPAVRRRISFVRWSTMKQYFCDAYWEILCTDRQK